MDAGKRSINDIFNGNRVLEIPFFQRVYVWVKLQWERKQNPYFLDSLILKQQAKCSGNHAGDMRTLQGQQRLTTLNILFKVLCLKLDATKRFDCIWRVKNNFIALWHNHNVVDDFKTVLNIETDEEAKGSNDIFEAYN